MDMKLQVLVSMLLDCIVRLHLTFVACFLFIICFTVGTAVLVLTDCTDLLLYCCPGFHRLNRPVVVLLSWFSQTAQTCCCTAVLVFTDCTDLLLYCCPGFHRLHRPVVVVLSWFSQTEQICCCSAVLVLTD